jgi:hypothetical protein
VPQASDTTHTAKATKAFIRQPVATYAPVMDSCSGSR